eukprot:m.30599 g.30599  ORF g.30599 m.30599 type:complete len:616 (+) comp8216_c0_seq1:85-1932(+)
MHLIGSLLIVCMALDTTSDSCEKDAESINNYEPEVKDGSSTLISQERVQRRLSNARAASKQGDQMKSLKILRSLITATKGSQRLDIRFELANELSKIGDMVAVRQVLEEGVDETKGHPDDHGHACYGLAKLLMGNKTKGNRVLVIRLLKDAVASLPSYSNAQHWLGHQLMRTPGGIHEALQHLQKVQLGELTDSHPIDTVMLRGQAYERLGDLNEAVVHFKNAIDMFQMYLQKGHRPEQKITYRFALCHFQFSRLKIILGEYNEALQVASIAKQYFPEVYQVMDIYGLCLAKLGRLQEAKTHYKNFLATIKSWPKDMRKMPERVVGSTWAWISFLSNKDTFEKQEKQDKSGCTTNEIDLGGNWGRSHVSQCGTCNIDRRPGLTKEEFLREYADRNIPVIIPNGLKDWQASGVWDRDNFLSEFGNQTVTIRHGTDVSYEQEWGGMSVKKIQLSEYLANISEEEKSSCINQDPLYLFGTKRESPVQPNHAAYHTYFEDNRFSWENSEREEAALFFLGPQCSGVTFHEHTNAWNGLVYGRKKWYLLPPYAHYGPINLPLEDWKNNWYPKFKTNVFQCTQESGEILYVPSNWMHSTLNLAPSIGIAVEIGYNQQLLQGI